MPRQVTYKPSEVVDFVIVGSGAAGGVLAKELATAGFKVVVLEQGRYFQPEEFSHDEVKLRQEFMLVNDPRHQPMTFRKTPQEKAQNQFSVLYGRCVGGGTVHFTANYWRFHEIDFVERSRLGPISGTAFADWPLTYADLEPYYTKVEWEVGVSGLASASPFDPPRSRPYPVPPLAVKSGGVIFERSAWKLGWHPFPAPMAIISQPHLERAPCIYCPHCEFFGCEVGAKSSTLASVIPVAQRTGRCEIRPLSYAFRVETDAAGRATGVAYFDTERRQQFQKARAVILSANGAETPRLLLLSQSPRFPDGLANSSGLVGKNLMINCYHEVCGTFEQPLDDYKGPAVSRVLHDLYEADLQRGFYGGGGMDARFGHPPISFALSGLPPDAPHWGSAFKKVLAESFERTLILGCHSTSLPVESNSFSLDPDLKDDWGLPALRFTYKDHPDDLKMVQFLVDRGTELLHAAQARSVWSRPVQEQTLAVHLPHGKGSQDFRD